MGHRPSTTRQRPGTSNRRSPGRRPANGRARPLTLLALVALAVAVGLAACSAGSSSSEDDDDASGTGGTGGGLLFGGSNTGGGGLPPSVAFVQGKVLAPEGTIPISGALVYATKTPPEPLPQGVYCERCVDLPSYVRYVLTEPDGTFTLGVPELGDFHLVVQKGSFRRVRPLSVTTEGETIQVGADMTTLPAQSSPSTGDTIPRMAVSYGMYDHIHATLEKLGLQAGVAFDIYQQLGYPPGSDLLTDSALLESYNIVFFPCTESWPNSYVHDPAIVNNLRNFVGKGGRLYVTDWTYDVLKQVFLQETPLAWKYDDGSDDSAQYYGSDSSSGLVEYDAPATASDPGLASWLAAQGIANFVAEENWTIVENTNQYTAPDEDSAMTSMQPTTWVTGAIPSEGSYPCTVSFQYGCGRALFSTYHTEPSYGGGPLVEQERVLLYIILEIGVCLGDYPPPR